MYNILKTNLNGKLEINKKLTSDLKFECNHNVHVDAFQYVS